MSDRMQKITDESEVGTTELATVLGASARWTIGYMEI